MYQKKDNSHKEWAKGKKPSMHRRAEWYDYKGRRIYMITISTHRRRQCLGTLICPEGWNSVMNFNKIDSAKDGLVSRGLTSANTAPFIRLSPLGKMVSYCWDEVIGEYPQLESICFQVMPDHIHGIIFVKDTLPLHLGNIIGKFKLISSKKVDSVFAEVEPRPTQPQPLGLEQAGNSSQNKYDNHLHFDRLWEDGFHDRILDSSMQLENMKNYICENPLRLAVKINSSDFFEQRQVEYAGLSFCAIGNLKLLYSEDKIHVKCSRSLTDNQIEEEKRKYLEFSGRGGVMVSPFISSGEKIVAKSIVDNGYPLILIVENGFDSFFKPNGKYFYACANGKILIIAPWEHHNEKRKITRKECLKLNLIAETICSC